MNLNILKKKLFRYVKTIAHLTKGYPIVKLFPLKIRTSLRTRISYNISYIIAQQQLNMQNTPKHWKTHFQSKVTNVAKLERKLKKPQINIEKIL